MDSQRATVELEDHGKPAAVEPVEADGLQGGARIARYVILHRHGTGGMGHVYAAFDPELDRKVALKLLRPRYASKKNKKRSTAARSRMMREAQALARLSHPNVVAIHDVGLHDGRLFLAMDFVEGQTLERWINATTRTWQEIVRVYVQAGRGLAGAHEAGLVHRDFKPQNAIVGSDGRVRVLDFGLARAQAVSDSGSSGEPASPVMTRAIAAPLTVDGAVVGTPAYMAPEQHLREVTDARTDQFAFCICMYEALYRRPPFAGDGEELKDNVIADNLIDPPAHAKVPARIRRALVRGLRRDPARRHESMDALLAELQQRPWSGLHKAAIAVGAAGVMGLAAYVGAQAAVDPGAQCGEPGQQLRGIWDDARKERIAAAFASTDKPYAKTVWRTTASLVDAHAEAWAEARQAACEAAWDSDAQAETEGYLRMACLQTRLEELSALADVLEQVDGAIVERAVQAAGSLGSVGRCEDVEAFSARTPTPGNADARAIVADLRARLVRAQAQADAGSYDAALEQAQACAGEARSSAFRPVEAEALVVVGTLLTRMGRTADAEIYLRDAIVAAEAGGHTEAAARAWIELLDVAQLKPDLLPQTAYWEQHAAALLEHLGDAPAIRARLLYNVGNLRGTQGKVDAAVAKHLQALEIRERLHGGKNVDVGVSLRGVGYALQAAGRYDEALANFQRSKDVLEALVGPEHPEVASTLTGIAMTREELGETGASRSLYEHAQRIFEQAHGPDHPKVAAAVNNVAGVLYAEGKHREALAGFTRALSIWERAYGPEHPDVALTLGNVGLVLDALRRYDEALDHHKRGLEITQEVFGPKHPEVAVPLINLGDLYAFLERPQDALAMHGRAAEILRGALGPDHPRVARAQLAVSYDHELLGDVELALEGYRRASQVLQAALGSEHVSYAEAVARIGLAQLELGKRVDARVRLEAALAVYGSASDDGVAAEAAFGLARVLGHDDPRAQDLAGRARQTFAADDTAAEELAAVDAFLAGEDG